MQIHRRRLLAAGAGGAILLGTPGISYAASRPQLTHGVQSGDVTDRGAILWTRADRGSRMRVELATRPDFKHARTIEGPALTADSDFTGKLKLNGLRPGQRYHYRITAEGERDSEPLEGSFATAACEPADIRFQWSGDLAGQGWGINPEFGGFRIFQAMADAEPDFFLCSGDFVYADGPIVESVELPDGTTWKNTVTAEKSKVAETLDEYRGQFKYNLIDENLRAFLAQVPMVNQWDDHEVVNNWYPGEILDLPQYTEKNVDVLAARARQAFAEYTPGGFGATDADGRIYRKIAYGPLLDVFVLDMRTFKSANPDADTAPGEVLGAAQLEWLKRELRRSKATWKVIAADLPIGLIVGDGAGAQEGVSNGTGGAPGGREAEIADLLSYAKSRGVKNMVWLTADVHYTAAHHYSPDRAVFQDFDPFWEFVSGPLNAGAFGPNKLDATFGPEAVFVQAPPAANTPPALGYQFFGEVGIDAETEMLTVALKDLDGNTLFLKTLEPAA
ncbi:alkaline phosphatase D family protein [Glycomyces luteolus]|uniref:Alkaline phosphatase D family protein n=1 Tax=Glycomyces luteolus TaxID=2670330 RepID=A0A9X3SQL2_9ACTN|nr:alkaline phosphatase D family protein [Glycomyces luteolus]MDA1360657.1 alkaline phosphatase D family protein [Glycomyces luteolus]